jgi:hypothetical protein
VGPLANRIRIAPIDRKEESLWTRDSCFASFVQFSLVTSSEAPGYRTSTGVALFLTGMGAGVLLGVLLAPDSGSRTGEVNEDGSGSGGFATRPREPLGETAVQSTAGSEALLSYFHYVSS